MKIDDKISVRGAINALSVDGELELPSKKYVPSSVRSIAASLKADTGKKFSVSVIGETIVVTRKS